MSSKRDDLMRAMEEDESPQPAAVLPPQQAYNLPTPPPGPAARASRDLIDATNGQLKIGAFTLTDKGLEVGNGANKEDWKKLEVILRKVHKSFKWLLADWLAFGEHYRWGEKYAETSAWTGWKEKTLRDYAYVASSVSLSMRIDKLSFAHHQIVAPLSKAEQEKWLKLAADGGWGTKRLLHEIQGNPEDKPEKDPYGVKQFSRRARSLGRLVEIAVAAGDDIDPKMLERMQSDLESTEAWLQQVRNWLNQKNAQ